MREKYGATRHVGREMPREIPKSWTYISQAWNKYARTPVTSAIENAKDGDGPESVTFRLYGDGSKQAATAGHINASVQNKGAQPKKKKKKKEKEKDKQTALCAPRAS